MQNQNILKIRYEMHFSVSLSTKITKATILSQFLIFGSSEFYHAISERPCVRIRQKKPETNFVLLIHISY